MADQDSPEEARSREAVQCSADQQHRDAWLRLHDSLVRTLDDLYVVCRGSDDASELVESTLHYLEQSMQDVRLLATTTAMSDPSTSIQRSPGCTAAAGCSAEQPTAAVPGGSSSSSSALKAQACSRLARSTAAGSLELICGQDHAATSSSSSLQTSSSGGVHATAPAGSSGSPDGAGSSTVQETLHRKLSSPDRLRRTPSQTKASADERHARAERLRERLADARLARLQEQFSKQQRRAAAAAAASSKDAEEQGTERSNIDKQQRSELLRAAHLRRIKAKAGDESRKVHELSFINTLTNAGKKADLQQRLEEGEARRAEALAAILAKQQGAAANIREAAERRRQAEAARLAQLASKQRRKEEAQAKLEQERRATAAAREAARAAAQALAQQREAAQQQLATQLRERVSVRLKAAAQRRLQHLEMIRERAALGKDFDRRDSFANASASGRQSPACQQPQQPLAAPPEPGSMPGSGGKAVSSIAEPAAAHKAAGSMLQGQPSSKLSALAPCFCPADAAASITVRGGSQSSLPPLPPPQQQSAAAAPAAAASGGRPSTRGSGMVAENSVSSFTSQASAAPGSPSATAVPLPSEVLQQLRGHSQSIRAAGLTAAASSQRSIAKGARRRMAKARHKMSQPGCCYEEPEQAQQLAETHEAHQLLAAWAPHLAVLGLRAAHAPHSGNAAAAPREGPLPSKAGLAGPAERVSLGDHGSMHSSATNSPRSSISSFAAAGLSTSTLSSTLACSPPAHSPAGHSSCCWPLSRSSSCCDADSHHAAGGPRASPNTAAAAASLEQQREALAALVASARGHMNKQQVLVGHMARRCGLLHRLCQQVLAACSGSGGGSASAPAAACAEPARSAARLHEARLLELLARLLDLPANLDYLLSCGELLPEFVRATRTALDHCNSLDADAPGMMAGSATAARLSTLLQVLVAALEHAPCSRELIGIQEQLVGFMTAAGLIGRLASVFSLFDQPMQQAAQPVPPHVLQCLRLLGGLTAARSSNELLAGKLWPRVTPNAAAIVLEMQATSMAGVLSLLTAVLLQASPTCTPAEASCRALPPNFVEAAHLVMAVLNNVCRLDLLAAQHMLACAHHRLEFYHLISFLLSYCLSRWPAPVPAPATTQLQRPQSEEHPSPGTAATAAAVGAQEQPLDAAAAAAAATAAAVVHHPIAQLLNQVLLLIGYFCVQHPSNQAMLTWGRSPSILQRLCSLPREYQEVPQLRGVLMPTMLCVCHGAERTSELVAQQFSLQQLLRYVEQEQQAARKPQAEPLLPGQEQQPERQAVAAGSSRRQRRRMRRADAQPQTQQQEPDAAVQLGQQLPTHAQEVLQQVSQCCTTSDAPAAGAPQDRSCAADGARGDDATSRGSWGPLDSGHQAVFALGRRFPLPSLPAAAEQLWQVVGRTRAQQQQQRCGTQPGVVEQQACQGGEQRQLPAARAVQQEEQLQQDLQDQQDCSSSSSSSDARLSGPGETGPPTALQLQRAPPAAAKACVVVCEVVACS